MKKTRIAGTSFVALSLAALLLLCSAAIAQSTQVQGVIDGRRGATMTVKGQDGTNTVVLLTDSTQVQEVEGGLHMRKKEMGLTALIPGLPVQVKGSTNAQNQLVADEVKFKGSDLKTAQDMQAGMAPVEQQEQAQQKQMAQQESQIQQQQAAMQQQQAELTAEQQKIAANKAAIAAANKRFGELGEYNILGEVTVLFANGKVALEPQYKQPLLDLSQKAKDHRRLCDSGEGIRILRRIGRFEPEAQHRACRQRNGLSGAARSYSADQHSGSGSHGHQQTSRTRYNGGRTSRQSARSGQDLAEQGYRRELEAKLT